MRASPLVTLSALSSLITFYPKNSELRVSRLLSIGNLFGQDFDTLNMGSNATSVPAHAVIVEDTSPEIIFHNDTQWSHVTDGRAFNQSLAVTTTYGASLSYSFDGVAIW